MTAELQARLRAPDIPLRLATLAAGADAGTLLSLDIPLGHGDSDWLHAQPAQAPYWYRASPAEGVFRLAIGHALHLESSGPSRFAALDHAFAGLRHSWRQSSNDFEPLAFAGFAFDEAHHAALPNARLAIPSILLESQGNQRRAILTTTAEHREVAVALWQALLATPANAHAPGPLRRAPSELAEQAWIARVRAAQRDIAAGQLDKLVLARSICLEAAHDISPRTVLHNLIAQQADSLIYAYGQGSMAFLGASPERLVRLRDGVVAADALAGTAWRGSMALSDGKNRHEQSLVVTAMLKALAPLCVAPPTADAPREKVAGPVTHLRSRISGRPRPQTSLLQLVHALHPTPAVGGSPRAAAEAWHRDHDERRNGWYSGGIGILTHHGEGEFSVALRSALIAGRTIELQAGAGIVEGSVAEQELAETTAKLGTLLAALTPPVADRHTGTDRSN